MMNPKLEEKAKWLNWLIEFRGEWEKEPSEQGMAIIDAEIEAAAREIAELAGGRNESET